MPIPLPRLTPSPPHTDSDAASMAVREHLDHLQRRAAIRLPRFERLPIDLHWRARGHALGQARLQGRRASISLTTEGWERWRELMITEVLPHEMAHLAIFHARIRETAHGPAWRELCRYLGGSGRATHKQGTTATRRTRQYRYATDSGREAWLGATRHKRAQAGARYLLGRESLHYQGGWRWRPD